MQEKRKKSCDRRWLVGVSSIQFSFFFGMLFFEKLLKVDI